MFALPDYWWLLGLAVLPQVVFAVALAISRSSRTSTHGTDSTCYGGKVYRVVPLWALISLCIGAVIGIVYGVVQHDAVFVLGQLCVVLIAVVRNRLIRQEMERDRNS